MTEPLLHARDKIQFRLFQQSDGESVRVVYLQAMLTGSNSVTYQALKSQNTKPWALFFYAQTLLGSVLIFRGSYTSARILGCLFSVTAIGILYLWRCNTQRVLKAFTASAITGDLADVGKSYGDLGSAFWVAIDNGGEGSGKVVGCVGLDTSRSEDKTSGEMRRMAVLPSYQGHGVGSGLLTTLILHAREQQLKTITLSTSIYQTAAMQMYTAAGFIEVKKIVRTVKFLFITSTASVHFYVKAL